MSVTMVRFPRIRCVSLPRLQERRFSGMGGVLCVPRLSAVHSASRQQPRTLDRGQTATAWPSGPSSHTEHQSVAFKTELPNPEMQPQECWPSGALLDLSVLTGAFRLTRTVLSRPSRSCKAPSGLDPRHRISLLCGGGKSSPQAFASPLGFSLATGPSRR
jgi:hypothetical protein